MSNYVRATELRVEYVSGSPVVKCGCKVAAPYKLHKEKV